METPKMQKHILSLPERQHRNVLRISIITAVAMGLASVFLIVYYISISASFDQIKPLGIVASVMIAGLVSVWFCFKRKYEFGIIVLIGSIFLGSLALPFIVDGIGVQFGLMTILLISGIASVTLTGRVAVWVVMTGIGLAIYNILIDFYGPAFARPGNAIVATTIALVVILVYSWVILRQYRRFRLRTKLIVAFVLVALLPLVILSAINAWRLYRLLQGDAEKTLISSSRQVTNALDSFINDQLNTLYVEAQLPDFRAYLAMSPGKRAGSEIEENTKQILTLLKRKKSALTRSYALLNLYGINVMDTEASYIGRNERGRQYFSLPLDSGLPYVSEILFDAQGASVYFSSPVWDQEGKITGILREQLNAQILYNTVKAVSNQFDSPEIYAVLVDNRYYIRYVHSLEYGLMYKSYAPLDSETVTRLQAEGRLPSGNAEEFSTNQPEMVAWLQNLEKQPMFTAGGAAIGGESALSTATKLQRAPWIVITRQPLKLVNQPVLQQTQVSVLLAMIIAIIASLAALAATQTLSAPIVRLTEIAEKVSKGDLSIRAPVEAIDEIGALATTFNIMTEELSQTLIGLEQRVKERTRAIELSADISRRLSIILDQDQLVAEVVELLQKAFDYYHAHIYLFDDDRENLIMVGGTGKAGHMMLERGHKLSRGQGLVGRACETGIAEIVQDTQKDPQWLPNPLLPETKSEIAVPIIIGDQVLGALDVQQNRVGGLGQQDADILLAVANQVAIALRNAKQFAETQKDIEFQTRANAIIQQIQKTQSVESALQVAAREIGRSLDVQRTSVRLGLKKDGEAMN